MNNLGEAFKNIMNSLEFNKEDEEVKKIQESVENHIQNINAESENTGDDRRLFSQYISKENAESIIKFVNNSKNLSVLNIDSFKERLIELCESIINQGNNPVEMLIYSTKSPNFNIYMENALQDILRRLVNYDINMGECYSNILRKWTWNDQLKIVIKSCAMLRMEDMSGKLMNIIEKNDILRADAALALIDLGMESYYGRIVNLFMAINNETREMVSIVKELFNKISKTEKGKNALLRAYFEYNNRSLNGMVSSILSRNLTNKDLQKISEYVKGNDKSNKRKAVYLLGRVNNRYSIEMLKMMKGDPQIDKKEYIIALGYSKNSEVADTLKEFIENEKLDNELRSDALVSLGNINDRSQIPYINEALNKAVETNNSLMEIAASSVLLQFGEKDKIRNLFNYLLSVSVDERYASFAKRQLRRVRGLNIQDVNSFIDEVSVKTMDKIKDNSENMILNILYILTSRTSDISNQIMLDNLNKSKHVSVKKFVIKHLRENFNFLSDSVKKEARNSFVFLSSSSDYELRSDSMNALKILNRGEDSTPMVG